MKSQALPEIPIIGLIGTIAILGGILIPPTIIKDTLNKEIVFTYESEKLQLALLALLSSTHDGNPVYELLANNIVGDQSFEFLKEDLDKLIESKCYSLQVGNNVDNLKVIVANGVCDKKYGFTTVIALPYNPDSESRAKLLRIDVG